MPRAPRAPRSRARSDDFSDTSSEDDDSGTSSTDELEMHISEEDDRHGKFVDLRYFMNITTEHTKALRYESPAKLQAEPGWIIHVKDNEDKVINGRMLLVLQNLTQSDMCLSFCLHTPTRYQNHWRVCKAGDAPKQTQIADLDVLEVYLAPFRPMSEYFAPNKDITLNLRDHWNIETSVSRTVRAAYIGRVQSDSLRKLSLEVQRTFCHYQNKAIPQKTIRKSKVSCGVRVTQERRRKNTAHG